MRYTPDKIKRPRMRQGSVGESVTGTFDQLPPSGRLRQAVLARLALHPFIARSRRVPCQLTVEFDRAAAEGSAASNFHWRPDGP
jgi:hypothetical protein